MKNKSILKVFGITLFITFILTWIIPSSIISSGSITTGKIAGVGFADIFTSFEVVAAYFIKPAIFVLFVGMFYGVANKSGALKGLVNKAVSKFKNNKNLFIILTVLFYSILTALTGIYLPVFMFIPLSIAILQGLKYNKVQSILATVGASTIGLISQVFTPFLDSITAVSSSKFIWIRVVLLIVLSILTILYILKVSTKKSEKIEETIMFIPENRNADKKVTVKGTSLLVVISLLFVVLVLGMTPWNTDLFTKVYDAIKGVKIGEFAIFDAILGTFETFGTWTYNSLFATIALAIVVLSISTHLSFKEMVEACIDGARKIISLAFITALISLVVIFSLNSGFIGTVINVVAKSGNIALVTISSFIGSIFMVNLSYAIQYVLSCIFYTTNKEELISLYGLIVQITFSFLMLIAPTSILLMIGLGYVEEEYSKWFKYIWKYLLLVLVLILLAITIAILI